jgi:hypothetical protein
MCEDTGASSSVRKGITIQVCIDTENRTRQYASWAKEEARYVATTGSNCLHKPYRCDPSDLQQFRAALTALQQQVDDLDYLKGTHYQEVLEAEDEVCLSKLDAKSASIPSNLTPEQLWSDVLVKNTLITRAEMDVYSKIDCKRIIPMADQRLLT